MRNLRLDSDISTHSLTRRLTVKDQTASYITEISTHSLTRRLTTDEYLKILTDANFNSQPHKEADHTMY